MSKVNKKVVALSVTGVMVASTLVGCASSANSTANTDDTVYGQVTSVDKDSLTIDLGTQKTPEDSNGSDDNKSSDSSKSYDNKSSDSNKSKDSKTSDSNEQKTPPSMLELTGESKTIEIDDDTKVVKENMGGPGNGQTPEKPSGDSDSNANGQPPEKPSGDSDSDANGQPPEKPSSDSNSGDSGDKSSSSDTKNDNKSSKSGDSNTSETETAEFSDISKGDTVKIELDDEGEAETITILGGGNGQAPGGDQGNGQAPGGDQGGAQGATDITYTAVKEYTESATLSDTTVKSTGKDENAVLVSKDDAKVNLNSSKITRNSSNSTGGDTSSFYGVGAAVLATAGEIEVKDSTITTDSAGGAGVFAYGNSTVNVSDSTITTKQDTSGGVHVAGGGTLHGSNLNVTTNGNSSAAIRSDRGSGVMTLDGGTYTSNGVGSPAIYSTADIAVQNAKLVANASEAICIEGMNSIHLYNSDLTGNMGDDKQNDVTWNVILYQSMSGDSQEGNSTFEMNGGTLTAKNGGMFYTTNTESTITLSDVNIKYSKDNDFFLQVTGNNNQRGWGQSGSNGADCLFTGINQEMKGNVIWDSISNLDFYMTDGSSLTGAFVNDETYAGDGGDGYCKVVIDKDSTWTVTGNSTVTELSSEGKIVDKDGKTVTIKGTDGTVYVKGDSSYTITTGKYSNKADVSGASKATSYDKYTSTMSSSSNDSNSDGSQSNAGSSSSEGSFFSVIWQKIKSLFS